MKSKFHPTTKIIANLLIITFLAQDVAWASPSLFSGNKLEANNLQVESFFNQADSITKVHARLIYEFVQKTAGKSHDQLSLEDVKKALEPVRNGRGDWFIKNGSKCVVLDNEVLISFSPGYMLRYFRNDGYDQAKAPSSRMIVSSFPANKNNLKIELIRLNVLKVGNDTPLSRFEETYGANLTGKVFLDRKGKKHIKDGIVAVEEGDELSLFYQEKEGSELKELYTKDGQRAASRIVYEVTKVLESGHSVRIKVMEGNDEIRGWPGSQKGIIYLSRSQLDEEMLAFHEIREAHYARHPEKLPKGVNSHTFIRGCGKDVRNVLKSMVKNGVLHDNFTADEAIGCIKKFLKEDRWNYAEFELIKYNEENRKDSSGMKLLYGEQDIRYTSDVNDDFTGRLADDSAVGKSSPKMSLFRRHLTSWSGSKKLSKDIATSDGYRHIEVEGEGYYVTLLISHADMPPDIKPSVGGVIFKELDKKRFENGAYKESVIEKAKISAKEIDLTTALWNGYLRGGGMTIISDGTRKKTEILKEVATTLAHNGILGRQFIAIADTGTFEEDMDTIRDAVYEEALTEYLKDARTGSDEFGTREIMHILYTREWDKLDPKFIWDQGIAMPSWGRDEDRPWELVGTAFAGALEVLLNINKGTGKVIDMDDKLPQIVIYGAGRVGRAIAKTIVEELPDQVCLSGISDEGGAVYQPMGLDSYSVMEYFDRRNSDKGNVVTLAPLDKNYNSKKNEVYRYSKYQFLQFFSKETDILVLAERSRALTDDEVRSMRAKIVIEALPGILTDDQINILRKNGKRYIPSYCIHGGALYGVRENLMHGVIPQEMRHMDDLHLHIQSGVRESAMVAVSEILDRMDLESKTDISKRGILTVTKDICNQIIETESSLWNEIRDIAENELNMTLEELVSIRNGRKMVDQVKEFAGSQDLKDVLELARTNYFPKGKETSIALMTAVAEVARSKVIYNEELRVSVLRDLAGKDLIKKELAAFHLARLQDVKALDLLLENMKESFSVEGFGSHRVRVNCVKALGFIYTNPDVNGDDRKRIEEGLILALGDSNAEVRSWARWAIIINGIDILQKLMNIEDDINEKVDKVKMIEERRVEEEREDTQPLYFDITKLFFMAGNLYSLRGDKERALKSYENAQVMSHKLLKKYNNMLPIMVQVLLGRVSEEIDQSKESAIGADLQLISQRQFTEIAKFESTQIYEMALPYYRHFALQAILNMYRPHKISTNTTIASTVSGIIERLNAPDFPGHSPDKTDITDAIGYIHDKLGDNISKYNIPYLSLLILYATDTLAIYGEKTAPLNNVVRDVLVKRLLTDAAGEELPLYAIESNLKRLESYNNLNVKQQELLIHIFNNLYVTTGHKDAAGDSAYIADEVEIEVPSVFDTVKQKKIGAAIWCAMNSKGGEYLHIAIKTKGEPDKIGISVARFKDGEKIENVVEYPEEVNVAKVVVNAVKKLNLLNKELEDGKKTLIPDGMEELYVVISLPAETSDMAAKDVLELMPDGSIRLDDESILHAFLADDDPLKRMLIISKKSVYNETALISAMARIGFADQPKGSARAIKVLGLLKSYYEKSRDGSSASQRNMCLFMIKRIEEYIKGYSDEVMLLKKFNKRPGRKNTKKPKGETITGDETFGVVKNQGFADAIHGLIPSPEPNPTMLVKHPYASRNLAQDRKPRVLSDEEIEAIIYNESYRERFQKYAAAQAIKAKREDNFGTGEYEKACLIIDEEENAEKAYPGTSKALKFIEVWERFRKDNKNKKKFYSVLKSFLFDDKPFLQIVALTEMTEMGGLRAIMAIKDKMGALSSEAEIELSKEESRLMKSRSVSNFATFGRHAVLDIIPSIYFKTNMKGKFSYLARESLEKIKQSYDYIMYSLGEKSAINHFSAEDMGNHLSVMTDESHIFMFIGAMFLREIMPVFKWARAFIKRILSNFYTVKKDASTGMQRPGRNKDAFSSGDDTRPPHVVGLGDGKLPEPEPGHKLDAREGLIYKEQVEKILSGRTPGTKPKISKVEKRARRYAENVTEDYFEEMPMLGESFAAKEFKQESKDVTYAFYIALRVLDDIKKEMPISELSNDDYWEAITGLSEAMKILKRHNEPALMKKAIALRKEVYRKWKSISRTRFEGVPKTGIVSNLFTDEKPYSNDRNRRNLKTSIDILSKRNVSKSQPDAISRDAVDTYSLLIKNFNIATIAVDVDSLESLKPILLSNGVKEVSPISSGLKANSYDGVIIRNFSSMVFGEPLPEDLPSEVKSNEKRFRDVMSEAVRIARYGKPIVLCLKKDDFKLPGRDAKDTDWRYDQHVEWILKQVKGMGLKFGSMSGDETYIIIPNTAKASEGNFSQPLEPMIRELQQEREKVSDIHSRWKPAITVFGSARISKNMPAYELARHFGHKAYSMGFLIRTGAGPSMMEAPMLGHKEARDESGAQREKGNETQGIRITLPFEQATSPHSEDNYEFDHFITRKLGLYENSVGTVVFPGGFGTMDELFEVWFRRQPVILIGKDYWQPIMDAFFKSWDKAGISERIKIKRQPFITDSIDEALEYIKSSSFSGTNTKKDQLTSINNEIEENLKNLSHWKESVTFIGNPERQGRELDIAKDLFSRLTSKDVPVRVGSRGVLLNGMIDAAEKTDKMDLLQATLLTAEPPLLTEKELSVKNLIVTEDVSNHHVVIVENSMAFVFLPGGVKTMSRLFDILAITQTGKVPRKPIILIGSSFWQPIKDAIIRATLSYSPPLIKPEDADLIKIVDTTEEALAALTLQEESSLKKEPSDSNVRFTDKDISGTPFGARYYKTLRSNNRFIAQRRSERDFDLDKILGFCIDDNGNITNLRYIKLCIGGLILLGSLEKVKVFIETKAKDSDDKVEVITLINRRIKGITKKTMVVKTPKAEASDLIAAVLGLGKTMTDAMPRTQETVSNIANNRALVLYADDILERGAAADLAYILKETSWLDNSRLILYGKNSGRSELLEKIINSSSKNKNVTVINIAPEDMRDLNGGKEMSLEFANETKELDILLRHVASRYHINSSALLGVIKGRVDTVYIEGIRAFAKEKHVPVVSFEHLDKNDPNEEVYSFREALNYLIAITKDITPASSKEWFKLLRPIEREDIERAYQDYRRVLKVEINA